MLYTDVKMIKNEMEGIQGTMNALLPQYNTLVLGLCRRHGLQ